MGRRGSEQLSYDLQQDSFKATQENIQKIVFFFKKVAICAAGSHCSLVKSFGSNNQKLQNSDVTNNDLPQIEPREETLNQVNSTPDDVTSQEEPVIIEPRKNLRSQPVFDEESVVVIEDDLPNEKSSSKFVRKFNDVTIDRQQNYKQVNCNGPKLSLAGTSVDNFLVVQSPYYPGTYPLFLW